jgi:hypothetical protein
VTSRWPDCHDRTALRTTRSSLATSFGHLQTISCTLVSFQQARVFSQKMAAKTAFPALPSGLAVEVLRHLTVIFHMAGVEFVPIMLSQRLGVDAEDPATSSVRPDRNFSGRGIRHRHAEAQRIWREGLKKYPGCIMREGRIVQTGSSSDLYDEPVNRYVADLLAVQPSSAAWSGKPRLARPRSGWTPESSPRRGCRARPGRSAAARR